MLSPLGDIKPIIPMPGGGTTQGHIEDLIKKFGNDVMIEAGGAIDGHPMGTCSGAKSIPSRVSMQSLQVRLCVKQEKNMKS